MDREFELLNTQFLNRVYDGHALIKLHESLGRINEVPRFVTGYVSEEMGPLIDEICKLGGTVAADGSGIIWLGR